MIRNLAFLLILIPFSHCATAQERENSIQTPPNDEFIVNDTIHRYQVGINTKFAIEGLFDDSIRTPIEIIVRRQLSPYGALRLRIMGISKNFKREDRIVDELSETHTSTLGVALGYEWQRLLGRRWKWYYGAELQGKLTWDNSVDELEFLDPNTNELVHQRRVIKRKTHHLALLPLMGIRFQITPFLFISTEIKMQAYYEKFSSRRDNYFTRPDGSVAKPFSEFTIKNSNINFQPYTGIFLNLIL